MKYVYFLYKPTKNREKFHIWKLRMTMTKKESYKSSSFQPENHFSTFIVRKYSLPTATSVLSLSPMAYSTTASSDMLPCNDYVDFGKSPERFRQFYWSKNASTYLDVKLKVFKKDSNKDFRLVQNLTMGGADFNKFMWLRNQVVLAAEQFGREKKLPQCCFQQCPNTWMKNLI